MRPLHQLLLSTLFVCSLVSCGGDASDPHGHSHGEAGHSHEGDHSEEASHSEDHGSEGHEDGDHEHDEVDLGSLQLGPHSVQLAQGHGPLVAGEEAALVVKLPFNDGGKTQVRAWLGGEDRLQSFVAVGVYAPSHDDYDLHAPAPDALSEDTSWWVEIELPDGSRLVGSHPPLRADE